MEFVQRGILKVNKVLIMILTISSAVSWADTAMIVNNQPSNQQAIANVATRINPAQIKHQQSLQNQETQLAMYIDEITHIPTWRSFNLIRNSRVNEKISSDLLIQKLNSYLAQNKHTVLTSSQSIQIIKATNAVN